MTFIKITLLIFIVCSLTSQYEAFSALCSACVCEDNEEEGLVKLDCSRIYFSVIPPVSNWPDNITHMDLSSNKIEALDSELAHSKLRVLDLSHNKIRSAVQYAFGGLKSLKYLNLGNNDIKEFEEDGFYGLDQLQSLNLSSNGLHVLPDKLFYHFIGLQELSLSDNPLVHLDPLHFNRMVRLRWLDLSYIDAYILNPKIFHTTEQLKYLDLSGNDFYEVPIDALRSAKRLQHLRLNENPISRLYRISFTKLNSLQVLELNYLENLKQIEDETFSELKNLTTLEIKYNRQLSYISPLAFAGLFNDSRPVLQELDLQGNQLRNLRDTMAPCARLRKFNIQQNPWNCDCNFRWIKDCQIQKIYLADLKCASPRRLSDALIVNLNNDELKCEYMDSEVAREEMHHDRVVRSVSLGLGVTMLVILSFGIALVFKWRDMKDWYKKTRKGPGAVYYVRARANPTI